MQVFVRSEYNLSEYSLKLRQHITWYSYPPFFRAIFYIRKPFWHCLSHLDSNALINVPSLLLGNLNVVKVQFVEFCTKVAIWRRVIYSGRRFLRFDAPVSFSASINEVIRREARKAISLEDSKDWSDWRRLTMQRCNISKGCGGMRRIHIFTQEKEKREGENKSLHFWI